MMHPQHHRPWKLAGLRKGFTLLEVLTVVVVLGIMATMAIPATTTILAQTRASRAGSIIASDLQTAFSLAAREREPLVLTVDAANRRYILANRSGVEYFTRRMGTSSEAMSVNSMTTSAASRTIFPNGMASGDLRITVVVGDHTRQIDMSRVGQVRVTAL